LNERIRRSAARAATAGRIQRRDAYEYADLESTANALVAGGKGILAADETPETLTKRFSALKIKSTPESRRNYREMLFTTPNAADFISGVIMQDETIRQTNSVGTPLPTVLAQMGMMSGIKVDRRKTPAGGLRGQTEGLDSCATFGNTAKWERGSPSGGRSLDCRGAPLFLHSCERGRAGSLCRTRQEQNIVPIVEPEVLMNGAHTIQ
jgi:fructose-bisphosphate aldolase class I